LIYKKL